MPGDSFAAEPAGEAGVLEQGGSAGRPTRLWLSELIVGGLVVLVGLIAWVSLALAHIGHHSLPGVLLVTGLIVLAVAAGTVVRSRRRRAAGHPARVVVRVDGVALIGVALLGLLALVMFLPGFHYDTGDKDPGGYVDHAMAIARTGDYSLPAPLLDTSKVPTVQLYGPGSALPGVWISAADPHRIVPQFYHLWPALLATSYDAGGESALAATGPLCGVLAVLAVALALRRAVDFAAVSRRLSPERANLAGLIAGGVTGLLLATNMLEVWQAKYPTTEISAQLLFVGALLGLVISLTSRWRPAAFAAGLLTGLGFLDRADGLLLLLLAAAAGAVLVAVRRFRGTAAWFAVGVAVVMPHALWQAYSASAAKTYSAANNLPTLTKLLATVAALYVVAFVVRIVARRPLTPLVERVAVPGRRLQFWAGLAVCTLAAGLLVLGFFRARLFGADYGMFGGVRARTYDEQSLVRLSWFLTVPAFAIAGLGIAVIALRRWSAALWALAIPLLLIFPVYALHARNSTRLMWWTRRFVPTVLPGLMLLMGIAIAAAIVWRSRRSIAGIALHWPVRLVAVASVVALTVIYLGQSWPLRSHDEMGGSFAVNKQIADLSGNRTGIYLWSPTPSCCFTPANLFAAPVWLGRGELSALLLEKPASPAAMTSYVRSFQKGFPGSPVFVVMPGQQKLDAPGLQLDTADRIVTSFPYWEETETSRPDHSIRVPVDLTVYRLHGT